jgi:hypothetical protein
LKLAGFLVLIVAAIPAGAQSGLEHGHRIGTAVAYLTESAEDPQVTQARRGQAEILAGLQIQFAGAQSGSAAPIVNKDTAVALLVGQKPSAVFETWAEQASSDFAESAQTGVAAVERTQGKAVLQRFVRDDLRQIYASYSVTIETLPEGTYRVSFGPPTEEIPAQLRGKADWKVLSPAKYPVPQILRDEDSIRLELYSSSASRRVIDYIHAGRQDRMVLRRETPHDYYADDAELAVTQPRLRVNGVARDDDAVMPETIRGPVLWVYIPGYGRYVLSLHAHADLGFDSAGEAAGNSLTFRADGNVFRIDAAERVAAGSGTYAVHVLPDRSWEPADPQDRARVMIGASIGVIGPGAAAAEGR